MASLVGSVGEFDPSVELFTSYLERLEQYFLANDIGVYADDATAAAITVAEKKKVAVMISVIGRKTYGIIRDLCSPDYPKDKTYQELCTLLCAHYKPKRLEVAETYRFHRCVQEESETVSVFSARLRHLASTCNFGEFLNRALRDQFVSGIRNSNTRKKLLSEDRTFQQALQVAIADEVAAKETIQIQQVPETQHVHAVKREKSFSSSAKQKESYACFSCGNSDHVRSECKFRNAVCHSCKVRGHIQRICCSNVVYSNLHVSTATTTTSTNTGLTASTYIYKLLEHSRK